MKRSWTEEELIERWTLAPDEVSLLANATWRSRCKFRPRGYLRYDWRGRSIKYDRAEARRRFGFRERGQALAVWRCEVGKRLTSW